MGTHHGAHRLPLVTAVWGCKRRCGEVGGISGVMAPQRAMCRTQLESHHTLLWCLATTVSTTITSTPPFNGITWEAASSRPHDHPTHYHAHSNISCFQHLASGTRWSLCSVRCGCNSRFYKPWMAGHWWWSHGLQHHIGDHVPVAPMYPPASISGYSFQHQTAHESCEQRMCWHDNVSQGVVARSPSTSSSLLVLTLYSLQIQKCAEALPWVRRLGSQNLWTSGTGSKSARSAVWREQPSQPATAGSCSDSCIRLFLQRRLKADCPLVHEVIQRLRLHQTAGGCGHPVQWLGGRRMNVWRRDTRTLPWAHASASDAQSAGTSRVSDCAQCWYCWYGGAWADRRWGCLKHHVTIKIHSAMRCAPLPERSPPSCELHPRLLPRAAARPRRRRTGPRRRPFCLQPALLCFQLPLSPRCRRPFWVQQPLHGGGLVDSSLRLRLCSRQLAPQRSSV